MTVVRYELNAKACPEFIEGPRNVRQAKKYSMKSNLLLFCCVLMTQLTFGQAPTQEYQDLVGKGMLLYESKDYKGAAFSFSSAFKANGWKAKPDDRYNAACMWAMANYPDSAFFNLELIASGSGVSDYDQ